MNFFSNIVCRQDTVSSYNLRKLSKKLNKKRMAVRELGQGQNDYGEGGMF